MAAIAQKDPPKPEDIPRLNFESATRLELTAGELPLGDRRRKLVEEIQDGVNEVNSILCQRDGLGRTPKQFREMRAEQLAERYANAMMKLETKHAELKNLEKQMNLIDPA